MIRKIKFDKIPPYTSGEQIIEAKYINFLFGLNGTGKTTISRYLRHPMLPNYQSCDIEWEGEPLECVVYNKDFVDENFSESTIPGIFTLGEENIEIQTQIAQLDDKIRKNLDKIAALKKKVDGSDEKKGLKEELCSLEIEYNEKFWKIKQQFDTEQSPLQLALEGARGSKEIFKRKLLQEKDTITDLKDKVELEQLCTQLFGDGAERLATIPILSFEKLLQLEKSDVLQKIVVGKDDVDIAGLIKKLGNDVWFKQGISYLEKSNGLCPFCQKPLDADFADKIKEYFDETYLLAVNSIILLETEYTKASDEVLFKIRELIETSPDFLRKDELLSIYQQLNDVITENKRKISDKKEAPNTVVQLKTLSGIAENIDRILREANIAIQKHNSRIDHIKDEKTKLTHQVWRYIFKILSKDIDVYSKEKNKLSIAIKEARNEVSLLTEENKLANTKKNSLEQKLTSIIPTATGINTLLQNYGFTGFALKANEAENCYQFVRANGSPAYESLSEGERNFVTFLYFIYSLKGNTNENKVVVIDDPVSSLDSDVLFLVSSLLRDLFKDIYNKNGLIRQLFILSHNSYFFKEVSYKKGLRPKETGYWMITKTNNESKILSYNTNPVLSTYEMLWTEIKIATADPTGYNTLTLANTMRRIIEYYFNLLGGINLNQFHLQFSDGDRQVFKSLISWANAGSHSAFDDYSATPNLYNTERYLTVFKKLFNETGHIAHYNMMMKNMTEEKKNG